tara:strand:- start:1490 stop:1672 length:183 start_codon:yes stop_codon:yes gene_type:complete
MERLFKDGMITTIIGLIIIGGAVYMYLSKDFSSMEAGELGILGMVFLRAKNSLVMLAPKK